MRRPLPRAALALGAAVAVVLAGSSGAAAAPATRRPGRPSTSPATRRTSPTPTAGRPRRTAALPEYGLASAQYIGPVFAADLLAQAARPNRPALTPATAVPGWNSGNPYRADWTAPAGR